MHDTIYYLVVNRKILATSFDIQFIKERQAEIGGEVMKFTPPRIGTELSETVISLMEIV